MALYEGEGDSDSDGDPLISVKDSEGSWQSPTIYGFALMAAGPEADVNNTLKIRTALVFIIAKSKFEALI